MTQQEFQHKYLPYAPLLFRRAAALLGNAQDAEDAVQDTFLKLWQLDDRLDLLNNPEAYLQTVLRNVCLHMLRARHNEVDVDEMNEELGEERDHAKQMEERGALQTVLARLAPRARRMVTLRHVGEYSTREISELTGETESNVRTILSRARNFLREQYKTLTDA